MPRVILFDLDKTLARSKESISPTMAALLNTLMGHTKVAVISGGALPQFLTQVIDHLSSSTDFNNLYLLPTSGGALYVWNDEKWSKIYEERIAENEAQRIDSAIRAGCVQTGLVDASTPSYGKRIEYRGAQVTFSALGQQAPINEKESWDPTGEKKERLRGVIAAQLPEFDVKIGGSTSLDITRRGVNKAYGVRQLSAHLGIPISDMLYVGDALYPGGNDEVVKESGIATHAVKDPEETERFIQSLLV